MAWNLTMASRIVKWTETLDPRVLVTCIWGTCDLLVSKVISGTFGALV